MVLFIILAIRANNHAIAQVDNDEQNLEYTVCFLSVTNTFLSYFSLNALFPEREGLALQRVHELSDKTKINISIRLFNE